MRIMTFSEFRAHSEPMFKQLEILKFNDILTINNFLSVYDYFNNNLPNSFIGTFTRNNDLYEYSTRQASTGQLHIPPFKTTTFGLKCIYKHCINSWNNLSSTFNLMNKKVNVNKPDINDIDLLKFSRTILKDKLTKHMLSTYEE